MARRLGVRVLVDQRDLMPETLARRYAHPPARPLQVLHWLERQTQRSVDRTVTVNGYLRDRLVGAGGDPARVHVVRNGPVLARVDQAVPTPGLRDGFAHLVTWAGKMGKQDRVDQVLRLAALVLHELGRRDCRFMLLGDGECLEELHALTRALDLEPWVVFPGWLPEVDLYGHLATADVGLDTSLQQEVTPVKALEYLALGLPLLAYDVEETRALATGAGVLVPPDDLETMALELVALLDEPARRRQLGETGRARVRRELAWEHQRRLPRRGGRAGGGPAARELAGVGRRVRRHLRTSGVSTTRVGACLDKGVAWSSRGSTSAMETWSRWPT